MEPERPSERWRFADDAVGVQRAALLLGIGVIAAVLLVVTAGVVLRVVALAAASGAALPDLVQGSTVVDTNGEPMAVLHGEIDRKVLSLEEMGETVRHAVLAAEDRRFSDHGGFDSRGILRALMANVRAGEVEQGASTITQQVARMEFLDREQRIGRKLREVLHAVRLEGRHTKAEIFEHYLNAVYLGSGAYGFGTAAEQFFRAEPHELTADQAALLAGLIRAPEHLDPREHPEAARQRRDQVLAAMAQLGTLDPDEARALQQRPVEVAEPLRRNVDAPYAVEAVKREAAQLDELGPTPEQRVERLFIGGLRIHTTLDRRLQEQADAVVAEAFPDGPGPTAALVSVDPRSGAIRALHGGRDFAEVKFDLATQGRRQPGSALKPFVAATALEQGIGPETMLSGDAPLVFTLPDIEGGQWPVENFEGASLGPIDLRTATAASVNTAYAQLALTVGVDAIVETAQRLGVDVESAFGAPETWGPSIALGGLTHGVTPLELAVAYGAFADHGRMGPAYLIERIVGPDGAVVYERPEGQRRAVIDPAVNAAIVELLRGVVDGGTGAAAAVAGWEALGKTGTTQRSVDAWFVGATATLSTAVWVGHPEGQVPMRGMTGGSLPARTWRAFMTAALAGVQPQPLPVADAGAALPEPAAVAVPDLVGMPLGEALVAAAEAGLVALPPDGAGEHPERIVTAQRPRPGSDARTGDPVQLRVGVPTRERTGGSSPSPAEPTPDPEPTPEPEPEPEPEPDPEPEPEPAPEPEPTPEPEDPPEEDPDD